MSHEFESGFSRSPMWHGLGTVTGEAVTALEAITAAGLDWTVEKRPVKFNFNGSLQTDDRHFVTVRSSDGKALGVVGRDFEPLQNADAFTLLDDLVGDGELLFDSAGSLRGGQVVWVAAKLPEAVQLLGAEDLELYAVLTHGHDGSRAIAARVTPILPVCMNTLTLGEKLAKSEFTVQHRSNAAARIRQGAELLGLVHDYGITMQRISDELAATQMELDEVDRFLDSLYADMPSETGRAKHVEGTKATLVNSERIREETRHTAWGTFNAVTEWWDWRRPLRESATPESRVRSAWEGPGRKYREKSLLLLGAK